MIRFSTTLRNSRSAAIIADIGSSGYIEIHSGTQPAIAGDPSTGTVLGTLALSPVAGVVSAGVLVFNPISNDVSADANGFATWGRVFDGNDVFVFDFDCGTTTSLAVLKFTNTLFAIGDIVEIQSFKITEGNE